jgi:hypothetical protein
MTRAILAGTILLCAAGAAFAASGKPDSIAGEWRFQLDRNDVGEKESWFARDLTGRIHLPGSLAAQGIGDDVSTNTPWIGGVKQSPWFTAPEYAKYREPGNVKLPFWLTPNKYYAGAAWYQRDIESFTAWPSQHVMLILERPHWETRVWVDDRCAGTNNALGTPHEFDLGVLSPGKHRLTIRVDNRMIVDVGENSHSISDHTQGNWNGIVGEIGLYPRLDVAIERLELYPDLAKRKLRVRFLFGNSTGKTIKARLQWNVSEHKGQRWERWFKEFMERVVLIPGTQLADEEICDIPSGAGSWDEFDPTLHMIDAHLTPMNHSIESHGASVIQGSWEAVNFGLRDIATDGTQFTINGRKTFIRGTLDCCIYPKTGHPPTDVASWKRVIQVCKAHGLNLIRFHSWCPPEAAFVAADELGFYFQVEASSWANQSTTLGDGLPVDDWIYAETDRILKYYGNHPSFLLMLYGNEPGGKKNSEYLAKYVNHYKALDPRRLWTSGAGWPQIPENQFHVTPDPRIQAWGQGLKSRINAKPPETTTDYRDYIKKRPVPVISHEIGQWCVYPNFDEIGKYTGYLKARNFEIFRDSLGEHHLSDLAHQFLLASGKLQTLCYKEDIESALRTPGMGGFELLDLHDFPGQGTALVGVLDPFWEDKGYVTAQEYSRFCNSTVPLARLAKRVFTTDETLQAEIEIAQFGASPMENATTEWKLVDESDRICARGELPMKTLPVDNAIPLGTVKAELKSLKAPGKYKLVVGVRPSPTTAQASRKSENSSAANPLYENDWDLWLYPPKVDTAVPPEISIVDALDNSTLAKLNAGGKVLLTVPPEGVAPDRKLGKVGLGFSSIFWNTAWTGRQAPHTLGVLVDPGHPLFAEFPTEFHSNWQWWYLISHAGAMILDDLPAGLRPTIQVIDDWVTNRKLGLLFEAKVGTGKLVVCSIDLEHDLENDPVRRQFRHSLLRYVSSAKFNPQHTVTADQLRALMSKPPQAR